MSAVNMPHEEDERDFFRRLRHLRHQSILQTVLIAGSTTAARALLAASE